MTTDAEIEEAIHHRAAWHQGMTSEQHKSWKASLKPRTWFLSAYLETSGRRSQLATALMKDGQNRMDFVIVKRRRWSEGGYNVETETQEMERLAQALDGTETLDRTRFFSLLGDLQALRAEQTAAREADLRDLEELPPGCLVRFPININMV